MNKWGNSEIWGRKMDRPKIGTEPIHQKTFAQRYGLFIALSALVGVIIMPTPDGLPIAGQRMLGILVFSVIVWMTEAVSYPVSAAVIMALMAFLLGISPDVAKPTEIFGTTKALTLALSGFSNTALALVGGAFFLAAAMTHTGLDIRTGIPLTIIAYLLILLLGATYWKWLGIV